jgi:hypothetical protein
MGLVTALAVGAGMAASSAIGAMSQKKAAKRAARVSADNNAANNALAREQFQAVSQRVDPFINRGEAAGQNLNALLGLGGDTAGANNAFRQFIGNSDYAFQEGQGERGLAARLSAAGGVESGAAQKALQSFRTGLQGGYRGQYMGLLGNQQSAGLGAVNALGGLSSNYVNNVTQNNNLDSTNQGNALIARGNANAGMWNGFGNALGTVAGLSGGFGGSFRPGPTPNPILSGAAAGGTFTGASMGMGNPWGWIGR